MKKSRDDKDIERKKLPIYEYKDTILEAVRTHQVTIVVGETGCGKTTQISQYLLDEWLKTSSKDHDDSEKKIKPSVIAVTNPRRVGAVTVARRVSEERGTHLGEEIGYSVRFTDCTTPGVTKIVYMTDGCLLRASVLDPNLSQYACIVLDEAHERSVNTDILFGILKRICSKRPELRLVITSATLDTHKFVGFFPGCTVIHVPGRTFPVTTVNLEPKTASTPQQLSGLQGSQMSVDLTPIVDIITKIHIFEKPGDILVFLTGQEEILRACRALAERMQQLVKEHREQLRGAPDLMVLPLYAALSPEEQVAVFKRTPEHTRKVVIATNIAETSLTIDGIVYVVDSGYVKQKWYNPSLSMDTLRVARISRTAAQQRTGRAGRTQPGKCFRLYSTQVYSDMEPETVPEILRSSMHATVLYLKELGVDDVGTFSFIDQPDPHALANSLAHLHDIGAVSDTGAITELGHEMAQLPVEPALARVLIASFESHCLQAVVTIVAMLSVENVIKQRNFRRIAAIDSTLFDGSDSDDPKDSETSRLKELAESARDCFGPGDHLLLLYIYSRWNELHGSRQQQWSRDHGVNGAAMFTVSQVRTQLLDHFPRDRITSKDDFDVCHRYAKGEGLELGERILKAFCVGFAMQTARRQIGQTSFLVNNRTGQSVVLLHPTSTLCGHEPELGWVMFHNLTWTTRGFMRSASPVRWDWLKDEYERQESSPKGPELFGETLWRVVHPDDEDHGECSSSAAALPESKVPDQKISEPVTKKPRVIPEESTHSHDAKALEDARKRYLARKQARKPLHRR